MSFGSGREKSETLSTNEEKKKELRRVYRKLKGVRSQISMKMRELKKEVEEIDFSYDDELDTIPETDLFKEEDAEDNQSSEKHEPKKTSEPIATQYELKMLVDRKAKLRKRFKKLLDEVQTR